MAIKAWCKSKRQLIPDSKACGYCQMVRHCKNLVLMNRKSKHKDRRSKKQLQLLERRMGNGRPLPPMPEMQEKFQEE